MYVCQLQLVYELHLFVSFIIAGHKVCRNGHFLLQFCLNMYYKILINQIIKIETY